MALILYRVIRWRLRAAKAEQSSVVTALKIKKLIASHQLAVL